MMEFTRHVHNLNKSRLVNHSSDMIVVKVMFIVWNSAVV
jgi:hypothetical protein